MSRGINALAAKSGEETAFVAGRCLDAIGWQVRDTISGVGQGLQLWAERAQEISCHGGPSVVDSYQVLEVCARSLGVSVEELCKARSGLGYAGSSLAIRILKNRVGISVDLISDALKLSPETIRRRLRAAAIQDQNGAAILALEQQICEELGLVVGLEEIDLSAAYAVIIRPLAAGMSLSRDEVHARMAHSRTVFRIWADIGGERHESREVGYGPAPVMAGLSAVVSWADGLFTEAVDL